MASIDEFSSDVLSITTEGHVATLWLDRESARNAMNPAFFEDLPRAVEALDADPTIRAVIIAARGPHFTVGLDLKAVMAQGGFAGPGEASGPSSSARTAMGVRRAAQRWQAAITAIELANTPFIAVIHGYCIGGGIDLITACDVRFSTDDAIFSIRETKIAIVADLGTLQRLPRIISPGHVNELALSGKDFGADHARRIGLVNDCGQDFASTYALAATLASEIAANSPLVVQGTKAVLRASRDRTVAEGLDYVANWSAAFINSNDLTEAVGAFFEKRPADFTGS